jgi:hypothetical protein
MVVIRKRHGVRQTRATSIATNISAVSTDVTFFDDPETILHDHEPELAARYTRKLPAHYLLPPTIPLLFEGTLEASLDALLELQQSVPELLPVVTALVMGKKGTDWPTLFCTVLTLKRGHTEAHKDNIKRKDTVTACPQQNSSYANKCTKGRYLLTTLLFLFTRLLLPNQILENRRYMTRLYSDHRGTYVRLLLRYDMLLPWKKNGNHYLVVPAEPSQGVPPQLDWNKDELRRPLYPNIWASLLAPPKGGYATKSVGEKLRHHITELDGYLLVRDVEVDSWGDRELITKMATVVGVWLWIREMNEILDDMEVNGWEGLMNLVGNEWFLDSLNSVMG